MLPYVQYLQADKAYDASHFREFLKSQGIESVIPAKSNRKAIFLTIKNVRNIAILLKECSGASRTGDV